MAVELDPLSERQQALVRQWKREQERPFSGWDFSYLDDKWEEEEPPWTAMEMAMQRARSGGAEPSTRSGRRRGLEFSDREDILERTLRRHTRG